MASYFCCCLLLQLLFGSVAGTDKMFAFNGMSIPLFSNLTSHERINLYRNGNENTGIIAIWDVINATITLIDINDKYAGKIFLDKVKTPVIWICNVDLTHSGKYMVQYGIKTAGPDLAVELTIMENKQLIVCQNSPPNSPKKCFENLTEDEFQKWLDDHPGFMKKYFGNLNREQIRQIRKLLADHTEYIKEYLEKVMPEQILQMLPSNHPKEVLKESSDRWNPLFLGLLIVTCITVIIILLYLLLTDRIQIREGLINMKNWIKKKLCSQHSLENVSQSQATVIPMEESGMSKEDLVHKLLNEHPEFMFQHFEKLIEDQMSKQVQKFKDVFSELLKDVLDKNATNLKPVLTNLAITLREEDTVTEDDQGQLELSSTYSSRSSVTFTEPGPSGIQTFNKDKTDPEQDMAAAEEVKEDSDTEDKCQEPLLTDHAKM